MSETIQIKYFHPELEKLTYIDGKSDWIDLRCAQRTELKAGQFALIPLGVAMALPRGLRGPCGPPVLHLQKLGHSPGQLRGGD